MKGPLCIRGAEVLHFLRSKVYDKKNGEGTVCSMKLFRNFKTKALEVH